MSEEGGKKYLEQARAGTCGSLKQNDGDTNNDKDEWEMSANKDEREMSANIKEFMQECTHGLRGYRNLEWHYLKEQI